MQAFPKKGLHGEFGKRVNNLRYVISAQQAQYVRDNYEGESDEDKLAQYLKDKDYSLNEPDRYHQKKADNGKGDFPDGYFNGNYKVVMDFNTEFILNSKGQFQNEIDPEGNTPNGVINGASFNYANEKGKTHNRLDANVKNLDPEWRNKMRRSNGNYKSPSTKDYKRKTGNYSAVDEKSNEVVSRKDKSKELKNDFKKEIKELQK